MRDLFVFQLSRVKWLQFGDANSSYFLSCINKRKRSNSIQGLQLRGVWMEDPSEVNEGICSHFEDLFKQQDLNRTLLDGVVFNRISATESHKLTELFSEEEIKSGVWDCEGNKSPGPDGFSFSFIKKFWELLKNDFCRLVEEFHSNGHLSRGSNASFLALIPKKDNPIGLNQYRPISLVGCIYKIVAKLLAGRLSKVMNSIISGCQTAFMKGRKILDGVVVVNEIIDYAKKKETPCTLFKVDFEKAYDSRTVSSQRRNDYEERDSR